MNRDVALNVVFLDLLATVSSFEAWRGNKIEANRKIALACKELLQEIAEKEKADDRA